MNRDDAISLCRAVLEAVPWGARPSYYSEPFMPHDWVIEAVMRASERGATSANGIKPCCQDFANCRKQCVPLVDHLRGELTQLRAWLDNNTTFYNVGESDGPVLASVSKRIWYHATDDAESYPFSAVAEVAVRS